MADDEQIVLAIVGDYDAQGVPSLGINPRRLDHTSQEVLDMIARSPLRGRKPQEGDEGLALFDSGRQGALL